MSERQLPAWRIWLRRLGPWAITAGVLGFLLSKYSPAKIWHHISQADVLPLFPLAMVKMILSLLLVSYADMRVVKKLMGKPDYMAFVRAKASSSFLDIINYYAGHGAYAVWFGRRTGADPPFAAGMLLYLMSADLTAVCLVAAGSTFLAADVPASFRTLTASVAAVLLFFMFTGHYDMLKGKGPRIFRPWALVFPGVAALQLWFRVMQHVLFVITTWWALQLFGIAIPFAVVAAYLPLSLVVGSLPINIAGFGTVQAVWLFFFKDYATGERLLAFHFSWVLAGIVAVILRGLPFIRRWIAELEEGELRAAESTEEATGGA